MKEGLQLHSIGYDDEDAVYLYNMHANVKKLINARLQPTLDRLGIKTDVLGEIAGIHARYLWEDNVQASDVATLAGVKALADAGIDPDKVGLLVNTSVSRDYLEPSTASIVSGNLGLPDTCQNFDVANACLAFINGMDIASRMIERGEIDYALIVEAWFPDSASAVQAFGAISLHERLPQAVAACIDPARSVTLLTRVTHRLSLILI